MFSIDLTYLCRHNIENTAGFNYMNRRYYCMFIVLFFAVLTQAAAAERTFNILFIQSYTSQTPWHSDLNQGLAKGFKESGLKVNITTEYLDADFWAFNSEKVIMRRFCQRARDRQTDLIVTASDEAFYTLFACGDSLPLQIPVVFFGIKYPDTKLITAHPNVCGFTANPDFDVILRQAQKIFPRRKEVVCVIDNSFLSNKGLEDFEEEWKIFQKDNPDYRMKIYNTQNHTTSHIIAAICYPRNSYERLVVAPKWSPFLSFVGKNSKAPVFSTQNVGLTNGVFSAYDADSYTSASLAAQRAASVLKGTSPRDIGVTEITQGFIFDYKQLDFFHIDPDKVSSSGTIVNEPYWEKYKYLFILLYPSILALLIASIVWLMRANRRESKRRIQAQTRLLVQNKLVEQRNEFDNVFHSIRDGVITYDTDLHIHFTNRSLLQMLHLPYESGGRFYEGMMAGSIFKVYYNGQDILHKMLKQVAKVLASNTNYATMVSAPSYHRNKVKFIQLSNVDEEQILAVIVTEGNMVKNKIIPVSEPLDNETMLKLNILLNSNLNGLALEEINLATIAKLKGQAGIHSDIVSNVLDTLGETMGQDEDIKIYTSGTTNLFKYPELSDSAEKASELISTFEEKQQLASLVTENLLDEENTGIQVYIGNESPIQTMKDCSVVTATYELGEGVRGTIGIVGPKRMDYEKVMANLNTLKKSLDGILDKPKGEV
mgnify:CR=1 FL=1